MKIKDVIFDLKRRLGDTFEIIGGGFKNGADLHIKKFCLEFNIQYSECPPYDYLWNAYCTEPAYMYGKNYNAKNIYMRNEKYSSKCDILVMFIHNEEESKYLSDIVARFTKKNKKILIIN